MNADPMHILILTYGTRGDVQPYIALGQGLVRAGHQVTLSTSERFKGAVQAAGLGYEYMNDDMLAILDTPKRKGILENTNNLFAVVKLTFSLLKQIGPMQQALVEDGWRAAQKADPDIIVFHPKAFAAPDYAEKLGIPVVLALVVPGLVPTTEFPNMMASTRSLGGWLNKVSYTFINKLISLSVGKHVKAWRKENALPAAKGLDVLHTSSGEQIPVLHGYSELVLPQPEDWPEAVTTCGYWFADEPDNFMPPAELEAFLAAGPAPVYVGFGSMAGRDPARVGRMVVEALHTTGLRGILATGWGGLQVNDLPDTVLMIDQVPHSWLFPQTSAIVHHGGAGTTAAALRSGKPAVVVPFFGDQPFWGQRVHALGVGCAPIPFKKLSADNLASALSEVISNEGMIANAVIMGEKLRAEDGLAQAVSALESIRSTWYS